MIVLLYEERALEASLSTSLRYHTPVYYPSSVSITSYADRVDVSYVNVKTSAKSVAITNSVSYLSVL